MNLAHTYLGLLILLDRIIPDTHLRTAKLSGENEGAFQVMYLNFLFNFGRMP